MRYPRNNITTATPIKKSIKMRLKRAPLRWLSLTEIETVCVIGIKSKTRRQNGGPRKIAPQNTAHSRFKEVDGKANQIPARSPSKA
ncbi:MAG: hypothetical protein QNJ97_19015 [Myxococcota bacterium]|nr:hypothetical protein [Myxococcota bacterium]